jgi:hypothetical protein
MAWTESHRKVLGNQKKKQNPDKEVAIAWRTKEKVLVC